MDLEDIRVLSAAPAHWDVNAVYAELLDTADAVLLMLNRIDDLRRLNPEVIALVSEHARRLGVTPVVAANDPHGKNPAFRTVSGAEISRSVDPSWPVFETTIGPFEPALRWSAGAQEVWAAVLDLGPRQPA